MKHYCVRLQSSATLTVKVENVTPGTEDQCQSLQCGTAALHWPGPRFLQPGVDSDEAKMTKDVMDSET